MSGQIQGEERGISNALHHVPHTGLEEIVQADIGGNLVSVRLIGRLQQGIAQAVGKGQIGFDAVGVLEIELRLIGSEVAVNKSAGIARIGQDVAIFVALVGCIDFRNDAGEGSHREVIRVRRILIHGRKAKLRWIQACSLVREAGGGQKAGIGNGITKGLGIGDTESVDEAPVAAELPRVPSAGPTEIIRQVVNRNDHIRGPRIGRGGRQTAQENELGLR